VPTLSVARLPLMRLRGVLLCGAAALALSACASNPGRETFRQPDFSGMSRIDKQSTLGEISKRYRADPASKVLIIYYAAALRANGQPDQAVAVMEGGMSYHGKDPDIIVSYAKSLSAAGRYEQALNVVETAIVPQSPDWNALLVKGAILDQMGRTAEARATYRQGLTVAPNEAGFEANLGLSYSLTNEMADAEIHLRRAAGMAGSTSQMRQNLALVIGLQGRFDEARAIYSKELAPDQVEANMAYIKSMLSQVNRWKAIEDAQ
jgi:Flp pilus assembly protein TadD